MSARPVLKTFPSNDEQLRAAVEAVWASTEATSPKAFEIALRASGIAANVHAQTPLAAVEGAGPVWYVFRNGPAQAKDGPRIKDERRITQTGEAPAKDAVTVSPGDRP